MNEVLENLINDDSDETNVWVESSILGEDFEDFFKACLKLETVGSRVFEQDGYLNLGYLDKEGDMIGCSRIMPDIVNVSRPNDTTVFGEFADGTKEVARLSNDDVFSMEFGVLICIVKKLFSLQNMCVSGSTAYNKIIKYALTKVDAKKKKRDDVIKKEKELNAKLTSVKQAERKVENNKREDRINEMAEAVKRALKDLNNK